MQEKRKYQKNDPTMIAPGYEPKLTLNFHYVDVTYVPTEALLARQRQEEIRSRVKAMDMPKIFNRLLLKTLNVQMDEDMRA